MVKILDSIKREAPVYFHFLDGYLNPDYGSASETITDFVTSNSIYFDEEKYSQYVPEECNIVTSIEQLYDSSLAVNYFDGKTKKKVKQIFDGKTMKEVNQNIKIFTDSEKKPVIEMLEYCIYQVSNDSHATSIVFFTKNNCLYCMSVNSGKGIENHKKYIDMYTPYIVYKLIENFTENFNIAFSKFLSIILISDLYSKIINLSIPDGDNESNSKSINITQIKKLLSALDNSFPGNNFLDKEILNIKITNDEKIGEEYYSSKLGYNVKKEVYVFKNLRSFMDRKEDTFIYDKNYGSFVYQLHIEYYELLIGLLEHLEIIDLNNIIDGGNIINYGLVPTRFLTNDNININFINKVILHYNVSNPNDLFIKPQESGSCSWFSMY